MEVDLALLERVHAALDGVMHPGTGGSVIDSEHVQGLHVDDDGVVRFQFMLKPEDPGSLVRDARSAVEAVAGVTKVKIDVRLPNAPQARPAKGRQLQPGSVPAPTPDADLSSSLGRIIAVSSGKGGVGKSTVAANLAVAIGARGRRVGLLDADIYGPDIPLMFGERRRPQVTGARGQEKIVPLEAHGVRLMSLGFLLEEEQPAIMRGPLVSGILKQFLQQVEWGELDFLIIDMPPGTGDAQLSLVQTVNLEGAILVTTPQEISTGDVRRAVRMFERVKTPILGIVENMSGFTCPHCGEGVDIFGHGGGRVLADDMHLPLLGEVPLDPAVRQASDEGHPTTLAAPDSPAGRAFAEIAEKVMSAVAAGVASD
jgi:ATP-binding protein involved in chromosome partitioning